MSIARIADMASAHGLTKKEFKTLKQIIKKLPDTPANQFAATFVATEGDDYTLVKTQNKAKDKTNFLSPYSTIGGIADMNTTNRTRLDIFDLIIEGASPAAAKVFNQAKWNRDPYTNETNLIHQSDATKSQKKKFSGYILELKKLGILKRIRIGKFMINPGLLKPIADKNDPINTGYDAVLNKWNNLP